MVNNVTAVNIDNSPVTIDIALASSKKYVSNDFAICITIWYIRGTKQPIKTTERWTELNLKPAKKMKIDNVVGATINLKTDYPTSS